MTNHYGQDGMAKQMAVDRQGHIYAMDLAISDNNDIWAIVGERVVHFIIQR